MNEPLKGKRFGLFDHHTKQVIETNYQDSGKMFFDTDIKSAVEWLKDKVRHQKIDEEHGLVKGLCSHDITYVIRIINKAFEDVTLNSKGNEEEEDSNSFSIKRRQGRIVRKKVIKGLFKDTVNSIKETEVKDGN